MAYEFKLPDLGEGVAEGEIARWLVEVGQHVEEDDPLVEINTDKTTVEIPSPASGTVARILVGEGELVPVGTPLVHIGDGEVAAAEPAQAPEPETPQATAGRSMRRPPHRECKRDAPWASRWQVCGPANDYRYNLSSLVPVPTGSTIGIPSMAGASGKDPSGVLVISSGGPQAEKRMPIQVITSPMASCCFGARVLCACTANCVLVHETQPTARNIMSLSQC